MIALYPDILPENFRENFLADLPPSLTPPPFEGAILERGLIALIEYLVEVRRNINKELAVKDSQKAPSLHELQMIIDTSLLKCYLQTNPSLVASLLRIDNHCHLEETEKALKKRGKYAELIILYKTKELHRNALDLLLRQARFESQNPARARQQLVAYLQELGAGHSGKFWGII